MKLPIAPSLNRQDFADAPDWISKLLYPLQLFMTSIYNAFSNGISFQDNISCIIRQFTITAGAADTDNTFSFPFPLGRAPIAINAICTNSGGTYTAVYPQVSFNYINGSIVINGIKGLTTGSKYAFTLVVF